MNVPSANSNDQRLIKRDELEKTPAHLRDPNIVGTFVYHCHLLEHEDKGMMGVIRVQPGEHLRCDSGKTGNPAASR
jgi:hypothetical protein